MCNDQLFNAEITDFIEGSKGIIRKHIRQDILRLIRTCTI
jgi:hypothetical protein